MKLDTLEKTIRGEQLIFTNQRALYWPKTKGLIISDLHIGKTAHFRKNGIPVPADLLVGDLARLEELVQHFEAEHLYIVGDFLHAGKNTDFLIFEKWRARFPELLITIIKGNHDRYKPGFLEELGIDWEDNYLDERPFRLIHIPEDHEDLFSISGHLHPGVTVRLDRHSSLRLPCFRLSDQQLILPAFSKFTGLDTQSCRDYRCIAFTEDLIFEL